MRRSNFALRLQPSLLEEARKAAELECVALNQLINVAVAEKISALRTQEYFAERARRSNRKQTLRILGQAARVILPSREMNFPHPKAGLPRKENLLEKRSPVGKQREKRSRRS